MTEREERRLVTVLFADLVGFTGRAEAADPEAVRAVQREYFTALSAAVERYGGVVEKFIGDAALAIFGAPVAHDDDAERALHAALAIRAAVAELSGDLEVRIGVNSGEVVGGPAASGGDAYSVTGDAVNVAARLEQAAGPGEIYVGPVTRELAAEAFVFEPLATLELRGRTEPVEAWRLVRALSDRPRLRGGEAPFVGRARELGTLVSALEDSQAGRGLLVAVVGEAGIGKTRISLELRVRAQREGFGSVWATARSFSSAFPYRMLAELAEGLLARPPGQPLSDALVAAGLDAESEILDTWAEVLGEVLGEPTLEDRHAELTPSGRQHLLGQLMTALLTARARERPQLVVLDDVHWADPASIAIVDELVERLPELPVIMVALYRPGWTHGWGGKSFYQQVNLAGLRPDDAAALARHLAAGEPMADAPAEGLLARAAGNPFFLEELLRRQALAGDAGGRVPETVQEVLLARIDALPPGAKRALQVASVGGTEFLEATLGAVEPFEDLGGLLALLQRADLVVPRGLGHHGRRFGFRHPLIHEVAYRSQLVARRRELHRRIGRWLEEHAGEEALPEIAAHYRDSDDPDRARELVPRAAARAADLFATREALDWYVQAAHLFADHPLQRAAMLQHAARQSYLSADVPRAIHLLSDAIRLYEEGGDELRALDARRWLGRYYWLDGRGADAEREIAGSVAGLERLPPSRELAFAYSFMSQVRMLAPDFAAGVTWARRAIDIAEPMGDVEVLVHAYQNLGLSLRGVGDPAGIDFVRRSLALALEHGISDEAGRAYVNLSGQGEGMTTLPYDEARALILEALAFADRTIPGGAFDLWLRNAWGEFCFFTSDWDAAERQFVELALTGTNRYIEVNSAAFRALLAAFRGRPEEAAELIGGYVEAAERIADLQAFIPALLALAHAEAARGSSPAAARALRRATELRGHRHEANISSWLLFEAVDVATLIAHSGSDQPLSAALAGELAGYASRIVDDVRCRGTPTELATRHGLYGAAVDQLGALGAHHAGMPRDEFPERSQAAEALDAARRAFDAARARLWLAEHPGEEHDRGEAVARALPVFERLGASAYRRRAAATPVEQ